MKMEYVLANLEGSNFKNFPGPSKIKGNTPDNPLRNIWVRILVSYFYETDIRLRWTNLIWTSVKVKIKSKITSDKIPSNPHL